MNEHIGRRELMQGVAVGAASLIGVSGSVSATTQQSLEIPIDDPESVTEIWTEWAVDDLDPSNRITPEWTIGGPTFPRTWPAQDYQVRAAGDKIVESARNQVTAFDSSGSEIWEYSAQTGVLNAVVGTPDVVAVQTHHESNGSNEMMLLDTDTGSEIENYYYSEAPLKSGAVDREGGWMWLQTPYETLKIDLESLENVWSNYVSSGTGGTSVDGSVLVYAPDRDVVIGVTDDASEVVISDAESGEEIKRSGIDIDLPITGSIPGQNPAYSPETGLMWIYTVGSGPWVIDTTSSRGMTAKPAESRVIPDQAGNPVRVTVEDESGVSLEWVESGYQAVAEDAVTNDIWNAAITENGVAVSTATDIQSDVVTTEYLNLSTDWPVSVDARLVPSGSDKDRSEVSGEIERGAATATLYTPIQLSSDTESVLIDASDANDAVLVDAGTFGGGGGGGVVDTGPSLGLWGGLAGIGTAAIGGAAYWMSDSQ